MLQRILCQYITPISKFKSNPGAALAQAQGDAIAVSSNNQIQFYAVPASLFEEMTDFCEFAQRGTSKLTPVPAKFTAEGLDLDKISTDMANKFKQNVSNAEGEFEE